MSGLTMSDDCYHENPREWDNLGKMVLFHRRYKFGDEHDVDPLLFDGWPYLESWLREKYNAEIILPVYMYDHGGIWLNTTGFQCPWDSGQVGYILVSREGIRKEFSAKRVSRQMISRATKILVQEVETYSEWLSGECCYKWHLEE